MVRQARNADRFQKDKVMDASTQTALAHDVRTAFDAYEKALTGNDVEALINFFWDDPRSVRLGPDGGAYGYDQIKSFRKARSPDDLDRDLLRVEINVLADDIAVANAEYQRKASGRKGAQSQVWQKRGNDWRIISAHVSLRP
tara:strand:- start:2483 stop:2908 length:426 start_codon:yes stop_codon:yes gene_type:complete